MSSPIMLSRDTLGDLPISIAKPRYDPAGIEPGIVHLGLGGFHRAHMARYLHDLMAARPVERRWGIVGAGLREADRDNLARLAAQDGLYTLVERDNAGETACVVGSLSGVLYAGNDSAPLLTAIDDRRIRIVSLTVTEHGYCLNAATKRLDLAHPQIAPDLVNPREPHSAIGIIAEAYRRRRDDGLPPFTALSCDNIQHNGRVLRQAVLDFAGALDSGLADWISSEGCFPSTMVDRITPVTRPEDVAAFEGRYGYRDQWPVFCEPFRQWVVEDDFANGRPQWQAVGVQMVADVAPYEFMKLRLLNTSHLAIAGIGRMIGYRFIHEAIGDPLLHRYMAALMDRETGPTVPPVPGVDLGAYKKSLLARFSNATIADTTERVNTDAPVNYLVEPIRDRLARGESVALLSLGLAARIRRVRGQDERGDAIDLRHPLAEALRARAVEGGEDPRPVLGIVSLFGPLAEYPALVAEVGRWLGLFYRNGAAATLAAAADALQF